MQLELARIFGFERLDINPDPSGTSLQVFVDGRSFRLSELGAGLGHFIVVLVNVLVSRPEFLLIDEPELNLHASLQLDFLTTLARFCGTGVLFATHSMGLARTAAEQVYMVHQVGDGQRRVDPYEGTPSVAALAGQLGFDSRPEVGYDTVVLVEGRSEVRALMQLLRLFGKEHRVALLPLGGGEFLTDDVDVELRELLRLGDVRYFVDSEKESADGAPQTTHSAFVDACKRVDIEGVMLQRRAFENYPPQHALDMAFGVGRYAGLGPYDKPSTGGWRKTQNWKVTAHMTVEDLADTDLGAFLESL